MEVVKEGDGSDGVREVTTTAPVIAEDAPVLEASDRMFDPGATATMSSPGSVAKDAVAAKQGGDELGDGADLVISGYVRIAKQDLDGARLLNRAANRNAAYLCEQAAEKLIRAVLTSEGIQDGSVASSPTWSRRSLMRIQ